MWPVVFVIIPVPIKNRHYLTPFPLFRRTTVTMAENIQDKIKNYRTAPFDARFPNTNQTRNCFQNYLGEDASTTN